MNAAIDLIHSILPLLCAGQLLGLSIPILTSLGPYFFHTSTSIPSLYPRVWRYLDSNFLAFSD